MTTVVVLNRDGMGSGDAALGRRLVKTFLQKARALRGLEALVLYNRGVLLLAPDSPVLGELSILHEEGIRIVPCGTCLAHFEVEPAVGRAQGMDDIVKLMGDADKVITL